MQNPSLCNRASGIYTKTTKNSSADRSCSEFVPTNSLISTANMYEIISPFKADLILVFATPRSNILIYC